MVTIASPASADLTATYANADDPSDTFIVEISSDDDFRITSDARGYLLFRDGSAYSIVAGPGGPSITTVEAEAYVARKRMENRICIPSPCGFADLPQVRYEARGEVAIAGYDGALYLGTIPTGKSTTSEKPGQQSSAPTGDDPAHIILTDAGNLLPIGKAISAYMWASAAMSGYELRGRDNLDELLPGRGVLGFRNSVLYGEYELTFVSFETISPNRFALPGLPKTLEDVVVAEGEERPVEGVAAAGARPVAAAYLNQQLFILMAEGAVQAWSEGRNEPVPIEVPEPVRGLCRKDGKLYLVTEEGNGRVGGLWSGVPGAWVLEQQFALGNDNPFIALDCSGRGPVVLTATELFRLNEPPVGVDLRPARIGGYLTTVQHAGYLYLGANIGEFGGGLSRLPLSGGAAEPLDASDPFELCGGTYNSKCDPITGLATDPNHSDCILVSVGLEHFLPNGAVLRVCDTTFSLVYVKPYTLETNWSFDANRAKTAFPSVAFHSLAGSAINIWAASSDGIYRFSAAPSPEFFAFPPTYQLPENGIDWSNPGFVLVGTDMNRALSVSGGSLILVPR
ncbi:MAG: hypothetical protein WBC90_08100 [Albidovulum sp.]